MDAGRALAHGDRAQLLGHADRLRALGDQRGLIARARAHEGPVAVVVARVGPAAELATGVVVLAVQQVRIADRPGRRAPPLVARHHVERPVLVLDVQLAQQLGMGAVVRAGALEVEAHEPRVPAVAHDRRQHVGALAEQPGHVVRGVLDPLAVVGPAGGQHRVPDARAVDVQLDDPASGGVEHGAADRGARVERASQVGSRAAALEHDVGGPLGLAARHGDARVLGVVARDPVRAPLAQRGAKARRLAPRRLGAVLVPYLHTPPAVRRRRQRAPRVHDVDGARRLDAAAVPEGRLAVRARRHDDAVRRLALRALGGLERPAQPRGRIVQARHVPPVLAAQRDRAHQIFPRVEARTMSSGTNVTPWCSWASSIVSAIRSSVAVRPSLSRGCRTEVRGTAAAAAKSMSS